MEETPAGREPQPQRPDGTVDTRRRDWGATSAGQVGVVGATWGWRMVELDGLVAALVFNIL